MKRRKHSRRGLHLPISFSGSGVAGEGVVLNLSEEGCAGESDAGLQPGMHLRLQILTPKHFVPMSVDLALVRWAQKRKFGLEFLLIQPDERVRLHKILNSQNM